MNEVRVVGIGILAAVLLGCTETAPVERKASPSADETSSVKQLLNKGILQLQVNLKGLTKRIDELQRLPKVADPMLHELRALDLTGWQLHQHQWQMQLDHLHFAQAQLGLAEERPAERPQLLQEWVVRQRDYERAMDELREQRQALERKRVRVEAQLVERLLRGEKG